MPCLCCNNACIEIKCSNSINYTESNELFLDYLCKYGNTVKLKQNHNYLMQYLMQKGLEKPKMLTLWFGLHTEW